MPTSELARPHMPSTAEPAPAAQLLPRTIDKLLAAALATEAVCALHYRYQHFNAGAEPPAAWRRLVGLH